MKQPVNLEDYGVIGDCRSAALVSKEGSIDWCCFQRFDAPAVFCRLLDAERGGSFSVTPLGPFESTISYLPLSNVIESEFTSKTGRVRLTDCFSVTSEAEKRAQLWPDQEILRRIECVEGTQTMRMVFNPRPSYGKKGVRVEKRSGWGIKCIESTDLLLFQTSLPLERLVVVHGADGDQVHAEFEIAAGNQIWFSLTYSDEGPAVVAPISTANDRLAKTLAYWRQWIGRCKRVGGLHQDQVERSILALKLMSFAPSGAVIAAPTTSLPEDPGGVRNWDYRYCWLRDASMTIRALVSTGFMDEAGAYLDWMIHSTRLTHPELQVVYSVYGNTKLSVREIPWLSGFENSTPVRVGNSAADQFQLDLYGEVANGLHELISQLSHVDRETRHFVLGIGKAVCKLWERPDHGIWEIPGEKAHYTHSKVMAWLSLVRLREFAQKIGQRLPEEVRIAEERIRAVIEDQGYNSAAGSYVQTLGGDKMDASLLVLPLVGYCSASSPRLQRTIDAVSEKLSRNGLIYRYPPASDGLPGGEAAFGICSFWMAEALARSNQHDRARSWFDELLKRKNSVGLWSEEIDPDTGRFLGNYPQAFTHVGLVNAAVQIEKARLRQNEKEAA